MDIYDSFEKINSKNDLNSYNNYREAATKYISQGFDEEMISELLQIDGCPKDISKRLANDVLDDLPPYYEEGPPTSYEDLKGITEKTILSASLDSLENYFKMYSPKNLETLKRIAAVRVCPTNIMLEQIHNELEPLVENIMLSNTASVACGNFQKVSSKEKTEQLFFGVWPIEYITHFNRRKATEKKLLKKVSKKSENPTIIF